MGGRRDGWVACGMGWFVEWVDGVMGLRVGFININDMYNNDVGKGVVYAYEAYEVKQRVAAFRAPIYFINLWLISDRHLYCTYLYYLGAYIHTPSK
jgi:hypothetical protein